MKEQDAALIAKKTRGKPFQPGNPGGGRPKIPDDVKKALESATPDAVSYLVALLNNPEAKDGDRLKAAEAILDRSLGKARQAVELSGDNGGPVEMIQRIILKAK